MQQPMSLTRSPALIGAFLAYTAATSMHFVHNAVFLDSYPNMPTWISIGVVFGTLIGVILTGVLGYLFLVAGYRSLGFVFLATYAVLGFDGLAHYGLAPVSAHTLPMNLTIWLEAASAGLLLFVLIRLFVAGAGRVAKPVVAADA